MTDQTTEKLADPFAKQIAKDLLHAIGEGQSVQDVIEDPREPLPEWLTEEEVLLLWSYLPEERRPELTATIQRIASSVPDAPQTFAGWAQKHRDTKSGSPEEIVCLLMLVALAGEELREWLVIYMKLPERFITLKRIAARQLLWLAKTAMEKGVAERKMKEVGLS